MTNNKNIKRIITRLVFLHGPATKNSIVGLLQEQMGIPNRTEGSISSLLAKNVQLQRIGTVREPNKYGRRIPTPQYNVIDIIQEEIDLTYTLPTSLMTPTEFNSASKCSKCYKIRILPPDEEQCLFCLRS